ncbi:hypothetical protein [Paenibacillus sp. MMS20-IR301]|uniref:TadE/TadG family type IV pilus assembly protein n=1 Tax=Paenibacillus sp. MMS20-IR301 TaxID=2895946 RepID=UPI0028ECACCA|nr:hypothetical protein [Paenibacillus sp. MMS20-IR301]WNS42902.1 hypothetical protein LOS79_28695 [Paenibacillus sp. MMS20-IR301]
MAVLKNLKSLWKDTKGDAVVEAAILFPVMIMIFAALVLLAMYLPTRAVLQRSTQIAATAIATERSDTWLTYDEQALDYKWKTKRSQLDNVYAAAVKSFFSGEASGKAETIVKNAGKRGIISPKGTLTVQYGVANYIVYKEIVVTATQIIPMPVNLSFIGFPTELPVTVTSTATVQNGDEFVRNMDLADGFVKYIDKKYEISTNEVFQKVSEVIGKFNEFLGI